MEFYQLGNRIINIEKITSVTKEKKYVLIYFNDRNSQQILKGSEADVFWSWFQGKAQKIQS